MPPLDDHAFLMWGYSNEGIPEGKCAAVAIKTVDTRQWVMAKNECLEKSVHVFTISKSDWETKIVHKESHGKKAKDPFTCEPLFDGELICSGDLDSYAFSGFVLAPGATGVSTHHSDTYEEE